MTSFPTLIYGAFSAHLYLSTQSSLATIELSYLFLSQPVSRFTYGRAECGWLVVFFLSNREYFSFTIGSELSWEREKVWIFLFEPIDFFSDCFVSGQSLPQILVLGASWTQFLAEDLESNEPALACIINLLLPFGAWITRVRTSEIRRLREQNITETA